MNRHIFEKSIIEKHIQKTGTCPITGAALEVEDLIEVQLTQATQPRDETISMPGAISIMQKEWDAVMLELYTLREQLNTTKQELSTTLYQHEAACRVVAKLLKEKQELKEELAKVKCQIQSVETQPMQKEEQKEVPQVITHEIPTLPSAENKKGINDELLESINTTFSKLSTERKKHRASKKLAKPGVISTYTNKRQKKIHEKAITSVNYNQNIITSSKDCTAQIFNLDSDQIIKLVHHTKSVKKALFYQNDYALLCSADNTASLWKIGEATPISIYQFSSSVNSCALLPMGDYALFGEKKGFISLCNLESKEILTETPISAGLNLTYIFYKRT